MFGRLQVSASFADPGSQVFLIQLYQDLSLLDESSIIHQDLFDDATGLGLDFNLGAGLYLACGHHGACQVTSRDTGQLRRVNLIVWPQSGAESIETSH